MRRINCNLIRKLGLHLLQSQLRMLEHNRVLDCTEADGDTGRVGHSVRACAYDVTRECTSSCAQYESESILGIKFETG